EIAQNIIKGRTASGTGDVEDLTGTQVTSILDAFTSGLKGLVPASGGGTTNYLRADGTFAAPPGSGTLDHAALTSNLAWSSSTHTGTANYLAGFTGAGAATNVNPTDLDVIFTPTTEPDITISTPNTLVLDCESSESCMFEPQEDTGTTIPIDIDFDLSFSNTTGTKLISMVLQLTGTRTITFPSDVLCSNASSIGTWNNTSKELELTAGTADIIEFQFLRYATGSDWLMKVADVPLT
ncbi:hypothetical protein, partial [Pseudoalteromonas sp.]|uniref:hypothetical protein n=1 Tax=Pseudoalteromonas sp. TaxID=53249 RepID=UPI002625B1F3